MGTSEPKYARIPWDDSSDLRRDFYTGRRISNRISRFHQKATLHKQTTAIVFLFLVSLILLDVGKIPALVAIPWVFLIGFYFHEQEIRGITRSEHERDLLNQKLLLKYDLRLPDYPVDEMVLIAETGEIEEFPLNDKSLYINYWH